LANLLNTRQTSLRTNGHILPIEEEVFDMEVKTMQVNERHCGFLVLENTPKILTQI
jgi:hypothetical protein